MYKRKSWRLIRVILKSIKKGSSINAACKAASLDVSTFWHWRRKDGRLDELVKSIYESRVAIVEDALYKSALDGNVTAQIFFLKNRAMDRWRDKQEQEVSFDGDFNVNNTVGEHIDRIARTLNIPLS